MGDKDPLRLQSARVTKVAALSVNGITMTASIRRNLASAAASLLCAMLLPGATAAQSPAFPEPKLVVTGLRYLESEGREWTRYLFRVDNLADYPNELFAPSPELPPCGTNTNSARTWVDLYAEGGKRLYGFCALTRDGLAELWFSIATDSVPPLSIYIELTDRKTGNKLKSNLAPTTKGPRRTSRAEAAGASGTSPSPVGKAQ
jgi:hypothetical protein